MKRQATLLEFAIGASLAVVPVLLAVLLTVAWLSSRSTTGPGPMREAADFLRRG